MIMAADPKELKQWILSNMTTDAMSELDIYKEDVAKLISLTPSGTVIPRIDRSKLDALTEVLLVLVGRSYAAAAGLVESDEVSNSELVDLVRGSPGGQRWALTMLRRANLVASASRGSHRIKPSEVGRAIKMIKNRAQV